MIMIIMENYPKNPDGSPRHVLPDNPYRYQCSIMASEDFIVSGVDFSKADPYGVVPGTKYITTALGLAEFMADNYQPPLPGSNSFTGKFGTYS